MVTKLPIYIQIRGRANWCVSFHTHNIDRESFFTLGMQQHLRMYFSPENGESCPPNKLTQWLATYISIKILES